jgi:hypothetical protein
MGKLVNTSFDQEWSKEEVAIGDTVKVRRPPEFTVRTGATASAQDVNVGSVSITIDKQRGVDVQLTSKEKTLDVDKLLENQILKAKAAALAQQIDADVIDTALGFPHWVGTPGQTINSFSDFAIGPQRMDELAIPNDSRYAVLAPADYWALAANFTSLAASDTTVRTALEKAKLPMVGNVEVYMSQNVKNVTTGTRTNGTISGANQNVTYDAVKSTYTQTLNVSGVGANATIKRGEVFTIANVNAVNPRSKADLGYLQHFVVLADATADGTGNVTLTIANPIITSGAYQTVTAAPANGAAVTWIGSASTSYRQNFLFHREAIALVGARLAEPKTGVYSYATDPDTGITVRYWESSDVVNDTHLARCDVLYGVKLIDSRLGIRLSGTP